jgi:predicted TIM-barrel fold metal-dependent hydrolase
VNKSKFDPAAAPAVVEEHFRGRNPKGADPRRLFGEPEPIRPAYRDRDARLAVMADGPVTTVLGLRAPADEMSDPFWRLANDSGITVLYHGGETAYPKFPGEWGESDFTGAFRAAAFRGLASADALQDTIASRLARGLFHRFPNLRMAFIETGPAWVLHLLEKLAKSHGQLPPLFPEDPSETFKRHLWVSPFYEYELASLLRLVGGDHILMARAARTRKAWSNRPRTSRTWRTATTRQSSAGPSCGIAACSSLPATPTEAREPAL